MLELSFQSITHADDLSSDLMLLSEVMCSKRESYIMEKRYIHKDGRTVWIHLSVSVIRNKDGSPRFYISQIQDINELKETQKSLLNHSRFVALGELSASMAHEINNPLTVINLHATIMEQMLNEKMIEPQVLLKYAKKITDTVGRINRIVGSLKKFARKSHSDDAFETVNLHSLVQESLGLCQEKFKSYGIRLEIDIDPGIEIHCNQIEISQVIINLINNSFYAVKDLKDKWVRVTSSAKESCFELRFTDSGLGIPSPLKDKIMDAFFTTKPPGEGSGLGLSISKNIIQMHKGVLFLDQNATNTSFVIELPLLACQASKAS